VTSLLIIGLVAGAVVDMAVLFVGWVLTLSGMVLKDRSLTASGAGVMFVGCLLAWTLCKLSPLHLTLQAVVS
jgi:hypothetical protein